MIRQVQGAVVQVNEQSLVVDVGGVGYQIFTTHPSTNFEVGKETTIYTHLAVRENALDLYGFATADELTVFELLITLPKIGPKSALQILSQATIPLLIEAVTNNDASYLSKMSGIGKKSAEKIVHGLKEKLDSIHFDTKISMAGETGNLKTNSTYAKDTIDALVALGYPERTAREVVQQITENHPDIDTPKDGLKAALKILGN